MHELSVCQGLLGEVARIAVANGAVRVLRISVAVGPLSGVEAPLLERAFAIARSGTIAAAAEFEAEVSAVRVWCARCGIESEAAINRLVCAECGDWQVQLRSGDELLLRSIDLDIPDMASDADVGSSRVGQVGMAARS